MTLKLDHFVFGAADLREGTSWMKAALGMAPSAQGRHAQMGTINSLWRLGTAYLEVIAIDPEAPAPEGPRWFGLDRAETQARIDRAPRLLTWVVATEDIDRARAASPLDPGPARRFERDDLHWHLTVPEDGQPHHAGAFPALIQWPDGIDPPSRTLPDRELVVEEFMIEGPEPVHADLQTLGASALISRFDPADEIGFHLRVRSPVNGAVHLV